jgi:putative MATE family efflux protein
VSESAQQSPPAQPKGEKAWQIVWTLAWPAVALNSLQTVNSLLDRFFIQSLEPAALTAVGGAITILFLFMSISFMMGTAATALVSRFFGARNFEEMRTATGKCLSLAVYMGIGLSVLAVPVAKLGAMAFVPADAVDAQRLMVEYLSIFAFSLPALNLIQTLAGSLRGIGDTKSPMMLSGIQIVLHILLNYLLIFPTRVTEAGLTIPGAGMGLPGAALALTISAWISAVAYIWWASKTELKVSFTMLPPGMEWTKRILRIALPSGAHSMIRVTAMMAFTAILAVVPHGAEAVAAIAVGFSIESLAFMPAFGLSVSAAALVGQSLGMKNPDRAERLGWTASHHAAVVSTIVAILLFVFSDKMALAIIPQQPEVAAMAASYIRFIAATETFFAYAMVTMGGMQGAGDTRRPMVLSLFSLWGFRIPAAVIFALAPQQEILNIALPVGFAMGANGCWLAMSLSQVVMGTASIMLFKKGLWKHSVV